MANRKWVRGLVLNTPGGISTPYLLGIMYNLWGYVLYGAATPTAPAAAAFPATNPNNFPAGSLEGGTILLASGTNGSTTNGSNIFTSAGATFTTAMIGSILVAWVPGSGSTDDGIYLITGVPSATTLQVQVSNGGHPDPTTLQPVFNTRSSILYRVVNIPNMNSFSWVTTDYMIFQLNPSASDHPNASQATSQVQFIMNGPGGTQGCNIIGSPAGTWNGSAFTDAMAAVAQTTNSFGFGQWSPTAYTMTADFDGIFCFFKGNGGYNTSNVHFEAPTRVGTYPTTTSDQNPLAISTDGLCGIFTNSTNHGNNNYYMAGSDGVTRYHRMQVKSVTGDGNQSSGGQYESIVSQSGINDVRLAYAFDRGSTFISPILLSQLSSAVNFTRCRALLKQLVSASPVVPLFHRLGTPSTGQYLCLPNGVCMIWDNTIMPVSLAPYGI